MPYGDGSDIALKPAKFLGTFAEFEAAYRAGEVDGNGNPLVDEPTLTDEQVAQVLRGDYSPLGLAAAVTAAAPPGGYTTGMIALLPTIADQERLAVEGGEDEEELHLTLCFLGEVAKIPPSAREQIVSSAAYIARERLPIVDADGFAIGRFNADDVEKETCVVLLCSGDELARAHREVYDAIGFGDYLPEQHSPWIPHVTLAYDDNKSLVGKLQKLEGPIRFDTLRVAFGDQVTDFPLYDGTVSSITAASDHHLSQPRNAKGEWTKDGEGAVSKVTDAVKAIDDVAKSVESRVASATSGKDVTKYLTPKSDWSHDTQDAVGDYAGQGFMGVNGSLRQSNGDVSQLDDQTQKAVHAIDAEMQQSQLYGDHVLYRSVNGNHVFGSTSPKPGTSFTEHGYSSTSYDEAGATQGVFGGGLGSGDVLMRVIATTDTGALNMGGSEHEVLLQRNLRYNVLRSYEKDGQKMVDVEVAPDAGMTAASANTVHGVDITLAKESDVNQKGGSHNLKAYWTHGPGAAKIGWGTDGSFARCVAELGKYVKGPQGLCAEYHHAATGEWPTEGGKHGIPSAVDITTFEEGVVADAAVDLEAELGDYDGGWEGPIMAEDSDTGDGRMFAGGSVTWGDTAETIHPLQWAASNLGEHKGSVTVGRIDKIWRDPENPRVVMGKGRFNVNDPDGLRAFRQTRDGFAGGISVDPDQISDADVELEFAVDADPTDMMAKPTKTIFHAGRLRGATLVAFPALVEAAIKLTKRSDAPALVAASKAPWRAVEHEVRLGDEMIDGLVASVAFAYVKDLDDMVTRQQCRFLHHEIDENGEPGLASLVACARHIKSINEGRTFGLSVKELRSAYDHMAQHFIDAGEYAPAFTLAAPDAVVAAVPMAAPLEWFGKPELAGPTPVTVTEDGRVFGHAATWGTCHTGFADTCVTPPLENDYSYFTTGEVLTAEGHRVAVGQITLGTSHAATRGLSVARAIDHYGDTGTAVADVTAGVDDHGIWIAGAVRPGSSDEHVHALRASALSGDWRRIGGQLRMVALLAVNVPGFPIPRVGTALAAGKQVSLVAAGVVDRANITLENELASLDLACGISAAMKKPRKKYASMAAELADLDADVKE